MRISGLAVLALAIGAGLALPARADDERERADPDRAKSIVAEFCVRCHAVPGYRARHGRSTLNAPPFQAMADAPAAYPPARLYGALRAPHYYMKSIRLSEQNIRDLIAFIQSLRKTPK